MIFFANCLLKHFYSNSGRREGGREEGNIFRVHLVMHSCFPHPWHLSSFELYIYLGSFIASVNILQLTDRQWGMKVKHPNWDPLGTWFSRRLFFRPHWYWLHSQRARAPFRRLLPSLHIRGRRVDGGVEGTVRAVWFCPHVHRRPPCGLLPLSPDELIIHAYWCMHVKSTDLLKNFKIYHN